MTESNCAPPPNCPFCGEPFGIGKPHAPDCQRREVAERLRGERGAASLGAPDDAAFQRLWTKYAALPEYVKDEWTAAFNGIWSAAVTVAVDALRGSAGPVEGESAIAEGSSDGLRRLPLESTSAQPSLVGARSLGGAPSEAAIRAADAVVHKWLGANEDHTTRNVTRMALEAAYTVDALRGSLPAPKKKLSEYPARLRELRRCTSLEGADLDDIWGEIDRLVGSLPADAPPTASQEYHHCAACERKTPHRLRYICTEHDRPLQAEINALEEYVEGDGDPGGDPLSVAVLLGFVGRLRAARVAPTVFLWPKVEEILDAYDRDTPLLMEWCSTSQPARLSVKGVRLWLARTLGATDA